MHDLIRVLRIRRLAALGVPLEQMPDLLDGGTEPPAAVLDRLDAELAAQIERLEAQRRLVAHLREGPASPDLPPELARFLGQLAPAMSPAMARVDRDQTVLLAHLVGAEGLPQLVELYEHLSDPDLANVLTGLAHRLEELDDDTAPTALGHLVEAFVTALTPVVQALGDTAQGLDVPLTTGLLAEYTESVLNASQQEALTRIGAALEALEETGEPG